MSIPDTNEGWRTLELKAQLHEAGQIHTEKVPLPTVAQQLALVTTDLARAKASIHRKNGAMSEAMMWMAAGEFTRAREALAKAFLDL